MKAKLSEIWAWAAKELEQIQGGWGLEDGQINTACALGAIEMFRSGKQRAIPEWPDWADESYLTAIRKFVEAVDPAKAKEITNEAMEYNDSNDLPRRLAWIIVDLNDDEQWSFAQFSKKAKELEEAGVIT
jgi:hypothetical protein